MNNRLRVFPTAQELGASAANYVADLSRQAIKTNGRFTVALSGGSLPKILCPHLVAEPLRSQIDWSAWHVFFADERAVPLTHPDSNYRSVDQHLFLHVDIPRQQIYAIDESLGAEEVAQAYEDKLQQLFQPLPDQLPSFDLILLGMGEDGHTASLFPQHPLLIETKRWVAPIFDSPKPPPERITLTLPIINNAQDVAFLATGAGKADVLPQVMNSQPSYSDELPARRIQPATGNLRWFVDALAASKLSI